MSPRKRRTVKYKLKTHKAAAKRLRLSGTGKNLCTKGHQSRLRRKKSKRVKRQISRMLVVESAKTRKKVKRLAPTFPGSAHG